MRRAIARGRVFPQSYSTDRRYGRLSLKSCALFPLMWVNADDQGRLTGDHEEIKYTCCPNIDHITKADILELLAELKQNHLIDLYNGSKGKAVQLLDWWEEAGAKLQWARPSEYDPPDGWEDRLRYKVRPEGPVITENWTPKDKIRNTLTKDMKLAILERDNYTCRYCGANREGGVDIEVAHIIPVREGGSNDDSNLVAACHRCNMQELGQPPDLPPRQPPGQPPGQPGGATPKERTKEKGKEIGERIRNKPGQSGDRPGSPSPPLVGSPEGAGKKPADPTVNEIIIEMKSYLGYPGRVDKDPIPSYGKEGQAIKRMLARGFTREEVTGCWKQKVDARGGEFVSMTWVNEDIGKKGGKAGEGKGQRAKVHAREDFKGGRW